MKFWMCEVHGFQGRYGNEPPSRCAASIYFDDVNEPCRMVEARWYPVSRIANAVELLREVLDQGGNDG